jgi:hypothetical protein
VKRGRRRLALIAAAAVAVGAVAILVILSGTTARRQPAANRAAAGNDATVPTSRSAAPAPKGPRPTATPRVLPGTPVPDPASDGPLVPNSGAYLGAFVQPSQDTGPAEIAAVVSFEHQLGHRLGLVHVYHTWTAAFPSAADEYFADSGSLLLITWGGTPDTKAIIAGKYDAMIRARAEAIKRLGHPVLLEFRHEMDRPDLQWAIHSPADYIAAWDHIRAIFTAVGADNASWVWCPTANGFQTGRAQAFYPGNNEVDWVCADAYSASPSQPLSAAAGAFLSWASHHPKPVLIGEFGVSGDPAGWAAWLAGVGQMAMRDSQIKALAYFDADGSNSQDRAYTFSLSGNPTARSAFAALLAEPYFSR